MVGLSSSQSIHVRKPSTMLRRSRIKDGLRDGASWQYRFSLDSIGHRIVSKLRQDPAWTEVGAGWVRSRAVLECLHRPNLERKRRTEKRDCAQRVCWTLSGSTGPFWCVTRIVGFPLHLTFERGSYSPPNPAIFPGPRNKRQTLRKRGVFRL